ncbi:MAG: hypothetical protein JWN01_965 [Patescibacteria group bacterium]|nr:hypothetical protein [Patescibacteria group bacterium]
MTPNLPTLQAYFTKLGLAAEAADIYLALHQRGPQTISALARNSHIERTRLYRLLPELTAAGLIETETRYKHGVVKAAPITNLRVLLAQKEAELSGLQDELSLIDQTLTQSHSLNSAATKVQFYQGAEGLRQMRWNELRAHTDIIGYGHRIFDEGTGRTFMERWAAEFEQRGLRKKILIGDDFIASWRENRPKVAIQRRIKGTEYNYIEPAVLNITHSCDIYDNVTTNFGWKDGEIFGFEIYNQDIADTQRRLLELIWAQSKPETRI